MELNASQGNSTVAVALNRISVIADEFAQDIVMGRKYELQRFNNTHLYNFIRNLINLFHTRLKCM